MNGGLDASILKWLQTKAINHSMVSFIILNILTTTKLSNSIAHECVGSAASLAVTLIFALVLLLSFLMVAPALPMIFADRHIICLIFAKENYVSAMLQWLQILTYFNFYIMRKLSFIPHLVGEDFAVVVKIVIY